MNPWLAILVFLLSVADDCLIVFYFRKVVAGRRISAALLSGALTTLISLEVFIYVSNWIYLIPNILGSIVGTWLALWVEEKLPKQKSRDSRGRFRQPIIPPNKIISEINKGI
jgi:hypothetical protein